MQGLTNQTAEGLMSEERSWLLFSLPSLAAIIRCVRTNSVVHLRDQAVAVVGWKLSVHLVMQPGACTASGSMDLLVPNTLECLRVKIGF